MIQTSFLEKPKEEIQVDLSTFQPKKLEEVFPNKKIVADTYMLYPTGGYHPFYGTFNTLPRYQLPIWAYIKRIKFSDRHKNVAARDKIRKINLRENHNLSQISSFINEMGRVAAAVFKNKTFYRVKTGRHDPSRVQILLHRAVALAWIPNPNNKPLVMHLNDDSTNYLIENLKWGTSSENNTGKIMRRPDTMEQKYLNLVTKGIIKG
tara:strand:+ start:14 stop:634 length:621 start_codon:yes stop_codon:yes gene_type:complete